MNAETFEHNGFKVTIMVDDWPDNPREEFDHLGEILYISGRYLLGDRVMKQDEIEAIAKEKDTIFLPVYAYIHSGVALSTEGFADPFDSGQCGIIYCKKEKAKEYFPNLSGNKLREKVKEVFESEIEVFTHYLSGAVYGYRVEGRVGEQDSCWGFYGYEAVMEAAKESADNCTIYESCAAEGPSCDAQGEVAC